MIEQKPRTRRHPNRSEKRSLQTAEIAIFLKQYSRKAQRGVEPNDRRYNRDVQRLVKRINPRTLDDLMRDDEE